MTGFGRVRTEQYETILHEAERIKDSNLGRALEAKGSALIFLFSLLQILGPQSINNADVGVVGQKHKAAESVRGCN